MCSRDFNRPVTKPPKQKSVLFSENAFLLKMNYLKTLAIDSRSTQSHRSNFSTSQVEREVVSVALVHYFHTQTSAVDDVSPSANHVRAQPRPKSARPKPTRKGWPNAGKPWSWTT